VLEVGSTASIPGSALAVPEVSSPVLYAVVAGATTAAVIGLAVAAPGPCRNPVDTLAALAHAVLAGVVPSGPRELISAPSSWSQTRAEAALAIIDGVPDDPAQVWAEAFTETLGHSGLCAGSSPGATPTERRGSRPQYAFRS
jgi:hypothetical protein